ncbi:MAG: TIGR02117 family protein [Bacteroidota bacterium]
MHKKAKIFRIFARILFRTLIVLISLFLLYGLLGLILSIIPVNQDWQEPEMGKEVFVLSNGVHLDLVLPRYQNGKPLFPQIPAAQIGGEANDLEKGKHHLAFGWGDKGFYLETPNWSDLKASVAINAALLPSATAMHVTSYPFKLRTGERCRSFRVNAKQLEQLVAYVNDSFELVDEKAKLIDCCQYSGYVNQFYEANGSYHLVNTCNQWVNQGLKEAGIKTALWSPFDWGVLYHFAD